MDALTSLITGRKAKAVGQELLAGDECLPVFFFDDSPMLRNAIMCSTCRVNTVLDAAKLHSSLVGLLDRDGWRKLRGRLRLNASGRLEIHVPPEITAARPAVTFSHLDLQMSILEHTLASELPEITDWPSIQPSPRIFQELGVGPNAPRTFEDYITSDCPQLSLHVVSFTDATLVSLTWPHVSLDGMSLSYLMEAWSLVLAGRDEDVPPMLTGGTEDPMKSAGLNPDFQERHIHESKHMTGWKILVWGFFYLLDILWWPRMKKQVVYIPDRAIQAMKNRVMSSLKNDKHDQDGPGVTIHHVSSSDIVAAFISNLTAQQLPASSTRSAVILSPIDIRDRMPSVFPKANGVYVTNAAPIISTILPARVMRRARDGIIDTAKALRRSLKLQTSEGQINALNRLERVSMAENGLPAFFGDPRSLVIIISDMTKARFYEKVDFGPAVLLHRGTEKLERRGGHNSSSTMATSGQLAYFHMQELGGENIFSRNNFLVFGTPSGGYWITGSLPTAIWAKMDEMLASFGVI